MRRLARTAGIANVLHLLTFRLQVIQWLQVVNSDGVLPIPEKQKISW
ncbi:MAG: hypothetical protein RM022_012410 [Nostoc sp. EfeVER01]|nr:hypothetical protein [Nostoc sp. EfeVER01]MDZ7946214.1 hypothetical protein [Nostoc sp. EfeVER01]